MFINKKVLAALTNALKIGMVADNPQAIPLIESVQPVVQVDDMKLVGQLITGSLVLDLHDGGAIILNELVPFYTAPSEKRAYILCAGKAYTAGQNAIAVGLAGSTTDHGDISVYKAGPDTVFPLGTIWCDPGRSIGIQGDHNATDLTIRCNYVVVEVDWS